MKIPKALVLLITNFSIRSYTIKISFKRIDILTLHLIKRNIKSNIYTKQTIAHKNLIYR